MPYSNNADGHTV